MGISLRPQRLKRYRDIALLLLKYGGSNAVHRAGLEEAVEEPPDDAAEAAKATSLAQDLERLGPTFIKLGQLLSTRHDLLPAEYISALSRLQDHVEPFPFEQAEHIIATELGVRTSKLFARIDPEPVASASLGQVHHAVLHDGRDVAIKVQRPGIRERIDNDLDALDDIAEFLDGHTEVGRGYSFSETMAEFRKTLYRELDYRKEAENMTVIGRNLSEFERIVIPQPVLDFTTTRVLTMDFVRGRKITKLSPLRRLELDGRELAEELFAAYLKQILADGFFHADPHPGNVFLTEDGRIALLDLGMTGTLSPNLQEQLLRLVLAMSEGRSDDAVDILVKIGRPTDGFNRQAVADAVAEFVSQTSGGHSLEQMQLGRRIMDVSGIAARSGLRLPPEMVLLARALINLDHVGRTLDPDFDPNEAIRMNAAEILQQRLMKSATPGSLFTNVLEAKDFVVNVPGQLNRILEHVANNDVEIKVDAFDEDRLMSGIHKIANRITIGLVLSALIIGAALLMRVPTHFTLLGYPGIAMTFFIVAAIGGLALVASILRD
ncbi:MAG TPA: AarF/ABC1/UbiB kinase family protein [Candidatus Dormibacteraeota bacterium]|nr:AarF/ABC1/UbiB kinase family protein [Candidatus Dormibacteraeota bacterium]